MDDAPISPCSASTKSPHIAGVGMAGPPIDRCAPALGAPPSSRKFVAQAGQVSSPEPRGEAHSRGQMLTTMSPHPASALLNVVFRPQQETGKPPNSLGHTVASHKLKRRAFTVAGPAARSSHASRQCYPRRNDSCTCHRAIFPPSTRRSAGHHYRFRYASTLKGGRR